MTGTRPGGLLLCAGVIVALAFATIGCGSSGDVAAAVAGVEYRASDLNDYLATTVPDNPAIASRQLTADWLSRWVFFVSLELELAEREVTVRNEQVAVAVEQLTSSDPDFDPGAPGSEIAIRQQALMLAALRWAESQAPDAEPLAGDPVRLPRYLCSRHILVASSQEAGNIWDRLDDGELFDALATELSLDLGSGSAGGELGCYIEGSLVPEFEIAAYGAGAGSVVVAESQFGFHVIEVLSAGPPTPEQHPDVPLEQLEQAAALAQDIAIDSAQNVAAAAVESARNGLLTELQSDARVGYAGTVEIDSRYGRWDPDEFRVIVDSEG